MLVTHVRAITINHTTAVYLYIRGVLVRIDKPGTIHLQRFFPVMGDVIFRVSRPTIDGSPFHIDMYIAAQNQVTAIIQASRHIYKSTAVVACIVNGSLNGNCTWFLSFLICLVWFGKNVINPLPFAIGYLCFQIVSCNSQFLQIIDLHNQITGTFYIKR